MDVCITIDVGTTFMKGALFTMQGKLLVQESIPMICYPANKKGEVFAPTVQWDRGMRELFGRLLGGGDDGSADVVVPNTSDGKSASISLQNASGSPEVQRSNDGATHASVSPQGAETAGTVAEDSAHAYNLQGIAISGHGPTVIPVFKDDTYAGQAVMWQDESAEGLFPSDPDREPGFGYKLSSRYALPKILKIREQQPETFTKTASFLGTSEFLSWLLTGNICAILPSTSWQKYYWTDDLLKKLEFDPAPLPDFCLPGDVIGTVSDKGARAYGIDAGVPVVAGGPDFMMALIGSGATEDGIACNRSGTSEGINRCSTNTYRASSGTIFSSAHLIEDLYVVTGLFPSTGRVVEWLWKVLGAGKSFTEFLDWALAGEPGAHGLSFLPHLEDGGYGFDEYYDFRGGFYRIDIQHTAQDMARAGLEGVLCVIGDLAAAAGCAVYGRGGTLRVSGGIDHPGYHQLKADIVGCTIETLEVHTTELMGDFIALQKGLGNVSSWQEGAKKFVKVAHAYTPDTTYKKVYDSNLGKFYHDRKWMARTDRYDY